MKLNEFDLQVAEPPIAMHSENQPALRLLYIEDDGGMAAIFKRSMGRRGFEVDHARDGLEGLAMIEAAKAAHPYDIAVVDYLMPGLNGLEVIGRLAGDPDAPPAIMLTGIGDERTAVRALKSGAKDYLAKDIDSHHLDLLPTIIEQVLAQERLAAENEQNLQALHRKTAELQHRNQELDAFAHTVAHDLKNPLAAILSFASLAQDNYDALNDKQRQRYFKQIVTISRRMNEIINGLLLLARMDKEEVQFHQLNMNALLDATFLELTHLLSSHHPTIHRPDNWPVAIGYAPWVQAVWSNYLSNAIKYGGSPAEISIGATPNEDGTIRFWVQDCGPGIAPHQKDLLFIPFSHLNQSRPAGHGLGLSIVQRVMDCLNGRCGHHDTPNGGSTFWFDLPAAQ